MTTPRPINVLFLCTHNSARSILAEALLTHLGGPRWRGFSAGSSPRENQRPHPLGLQALRELGIETSEFTSKSWDVFASEDAPQMDVIITVCDNAANEACPYWPGRPASAHWGYADPSATPAVAPHGDSPAAIAAAQAATQAAMLDAFRHTRDAIATQLNRLLALAPEDLAPDRLQASVRSLEQT